MKSLFSFCSVGIANAAERNAAEHIAAKRSATDRNAPAATWVFSPLRPFALFLFALFLWATQAQAQTIIVQKGAVATAYKTLEAAVAAADDGATVYIPSGNHTITGSPVIAGSARANTLLIDKKLNLIGAGASEGLLYNTVIAGSIALSTEASGSRLEGFSLTGTNTNIYADNISNFLLKRCRLAPAGGSGGVYFSGKGNGNVIRENNLTWVIQQISWYGNMGYPTDGTYTEVHIQNNIIASSGSAHFRYLKNALITNNFLTGAGYQIVTNTYQCVVSNNIINYSPDPDSGGSSYNNFSYNLCTGSFSAPGQDNHNTVGFNFENVPIANIFVDQVRYQLKETCVGKNAGTDGTDIGIYGGTEPAKLERIPDNPKLTKSVIGGTTDRDGKITTTITVVAQ